MAPLEYDNAFTPGGQHRFGPVTISKAEIIEFAGQFDPAPFHLDEEAAKRSILGGLSASGFQTCAMTIQMMNDAFMLAAGCQGGVGTKEIRWLAPVRPDDTLCGVAKVVSARPSRSRPDLERVTFNIKTTNQQGTDVLEMTSTALFRKPKA